MCAHFIPGTGECAAETTRAYLTGPRCADHTPARLAGRDETIPDPERTLDGRRRAAGINPEQPMTPTGTTLVDQRAIASGKRRSNHTNFRAAQAATRPNSTRS